MTLAQDSGRLHNVIRDQSVTVYKNLLEMSNHRADRTTEKDLSPASGNVTASGHI